jgi:hypothetical protein
MVEVDLSFQGRHLVAYMMPDDGYWKTWDNCGRRGPARNGASKAGRGEERRCQRRETRCETWWVQVPRRNGWPPAASESCVVIGDGGTKRRQRLLRPGASIPKEAHRWGLRGLRTRGQQGDAVTAWRSPPDRGMWPRHREQQVSPEAGRSYRFCRRHRREWESPVYQGPGSWVGFPGPSAIKRTGSGRQ